MKWERQWEVGTHFGRKIESQFWISLISNMWHSGGKLRKWLDMHV